MQPIPTTAALRSKARSAEERGELSEAADLYDQAATVYPGDVTGALAQHDIKHLRGCADRCRRHAERAHVAALVAAAGYGAVGELRA